MNLPHVPFGIWVLCIAFYLLALTVIVAFFMGADCDDDEEPMDWTHLQP